MTNHNIGPVKLTRKEQHDDDVNGGMNAYSIPEKPHVSYDELVRRVRETTEQNDRARPWSIKDSEHVAAKLGLGAMRRAINDNRPE